MREIVVHHLDHSRSHRVVWLLEELGFPYELKTYQRDAMFRAPAALKEIHPIGRSPIVVIDGIAVAESGAIVETLLDLAGGRFRPDVARETESRRYRFYMHYAEASLMPPLLVSLIASRVKEAPVPFFIRPITASISKKIAHGYAVPEIKNHLAFLDSELKDRSYLVGEELTGPDFMISYPLAAAEQRIGLAEYPNVRDYFFRISNRDDYIKAVEIGGPLVV
ncbi:MAG: glutathione S-transferase [Polyangiales bacterium]